MIEQKDSLKILVKYHTEGVEIEKIPQGDWVDLRSAETVDISEGGFKIVSLGVSMKLPDGYEAHIAPRSSTFKKWGIIQVNSVGVVDNSYCGDDDVWGLPVYAVRDTRIHKGDRIAQFRVMKKQETLEFKTVPHLDGPSRSGFGSTGTN